MKVKLIQSGFEGYTGDLGLDKFINGISTDHVSEAQALRYAAIFGCVWEDGTPIQHTPNYEPVSAPVGRETYLATNEEDEVLGGHDGEPIPAEKISITPVAPPEITETYTRIQLEKIADQKGIAGLRQIAKPLGIGGTSINGIIESILEVAGAEQNLPEGVERV